MRSASFSALSASDSDKGPSPAALPLAPAPVLEEAPFARDPLPFPVARSKMSRRWDSREAIFGKSSAAATERVHDGVEPKVAHTAHDRVSRHNALLTLKLGILVLDLLDAMRHLLRQIVQRLQVLYSHCRDFCWIFHPCCVRVRVGAGVSACKCTSALASAFAYVEVLDERKT